MKFYVGVTDNNWYSFLANQQPDEVNFWQPGGSGVFKAVPPGAPFLFKLHSPLNYIAGGAFFVTATRLPLSLAWETFDIKNGCATFNSFASRIRTYRRQKGDADPDPSIGCIVLTAPFFFPRDAWIPAPSDWKGPIVQGKIYDDSEPIGSRVWSQVQERLSATIPLSEGILAPQVLDPQNRYGTPYLTKPRLGQSSFRVLVIDAYSRRCAMTGERTLPVLQAAHIRPFADSGPNEVSNGLLLRSDLHLLFDKGLITVTPDYHVEVSSRIKTQYENGRIYYALHGKELVVLPENERSRPSNEFIEWHNTNRFIPT